MTDRQDSLDIMLQMEMEQLLKNPVIVEVLNLVYEGQFSYDSSALYLSQTFQSLFLMETSDLKSISARLLNNIRHFGDSSGQKQSSLQFNIWKQCIQQREKDEMLFTVIICLAMIVSTAVNQSTISQIAIDFRDQLGSNFVLNPFVMKEASSQQLTEFC